MSGSIKAGRAGGQTGDPRFPSSAKRSRSNGSEQKTTKPRPLLRDPPPGSTGSPGGAPPPAGMSERPQKRNGARKGGKHPHPSPGGGRTPPAFRGGYLGLRGTFGVRILTPRPRARGEPSGASPPPGAEPAGLIPSRPPPLLPGGAQSWPGPGLSRRPSRGPGRTGARRKEPPPRPPPPLPRREQSGTHPRETEAAVEGRDRGRAAPLCQGLLLGLGFLLPPP